MSSTWLLKNELRIEHIDSNSMLPDPLTKVVTALVFHEHIAYMGLKSYDDIKF